MELPRQFAVGIGIAGQQDDPGGFPVQAMDDARLGIAVFLQAGDQAVLVVIGPAGDGQQQGWLVDHQDGGVLVQDVNIGQRHYVFSANANGDGRARGHAAPARPSPWQVTLGCRSTIGQGDIEFQDRAAALAFQSDLHIIVADVDVLANHFHQFFLQGWQVIRGTALTALVRHDDL
ncbi:hypothetical protein D3C80_1384070 [compost metagenome]